MHSWLSFPRFFSKLTPKPKFILSKIKGCRRTSEKTRKSGRIVALCSTSEGGRAPERKCTPKGRQRIAACAVDVVNLKWSHCAGNEQAVLQRRGTTSAGGGRRHGQAPNQHSWARSRATWPALESQQAALQNHC